MKNIIFIILTLSLTFNNLHADEISNKNKNLIFKLKTYATMDSINDTDFRNSKIIVYELIKNNVSEYCDSNETDTYIIELNVGNLYSIICLKNNSDTSYQAFTKFIIDNINSADEQNSLSFENLFKKNPVRTIQQISHYKVELQDDLLNSLAFGILNILHSTDDNIEVTMEKFYKRYPDLRDKKYKSWVMKILNKL